ncbi:hypothetical protein TraAM80_02221 [Trypanosoma rangeli]|uniref:Uncharacterized protein n=1 Tax=Trypanosoma rangeli TaxID=5698 RepID=A0A3R7NXN4_TRYRA|nr:uncharacterized protein TraAM80_02221 [Trypanosoma rangeli]RNF09347.1 hypothetical protein TraAM80_02221 [Trypanosoma rangeli]|eukprot:RNF09347.1 hypothetical protein TraAM80_02221 [Trypanosoma rangeli]
MKGVGHSSGGGFLVGPRQGQQEPTDMFVACFEAALDEELRGQEISSSFRACFERISSPYGFVRNEGLRDALQRLRDLSLEAAEEAALSSDNATGTAAAGRSAGPTPHLPYDAIRSSVMSRGAAESHATVGQPSTASGRSASSERTQRALHGAHYTMSVFHRVLVPYMDERARCNRGGPVTVELSEAAALAWNTLNHAQLTTLPPSATPAKKKAPGIILTEVTFQEQELALRLLQGLSLVVYDQRRVMAEGPLITFLVEIWQCCLQHIQALFSRWRRLAALEKTGDTPSSTAPLLEEEPVRLVAGLETVIVASIDAAEAACHYNPLALTRIVQQGGVRALLDLGLCPYAPYDIRCAVFDTVSVLMQEVAPFRGAVTAGGPSAAAAAGGGTKGEEDELIQTMIQQAMAGSLGRKAAPPPFLMDRASASKFDSAVRDWFSQQGLSHVVSAVLELRDVRGTPIAAGTMPKAEVARHVQRVNQLREKQLQALLQAVDGKRAAL